MNISDLKSALTLDSDTYSELPVHVAGFCAFLVEEDRARFAGLVESHAGNRDQAASYQTVACQGFVIAAKQASTDLLEEFTQNIIQLSGRTFFSDGRVPKFEVDGVALLGVALGLACLTNSEADDKWFVELLNKSAVVLSSDDWECDLIKAARLVLRNGDWNSISRASTRVGIQAACSVDVDIDAKQVAWEELLDRLDERTPAQTAVLRSVFDCCARALSALPVNGAGVSELVKLLENLSGSMSHWTYEKKQRVRNVEQQRWEIEHEYHVQNLLWTVLRPVFSDLVDEQSLPKVGHKTPRYDLGIPSLQTIIEVKFMRRSGPAECRKMTEEIAADLTLYLGDRTGYKTLIAFIWDDCRQTEEYETLKSLEKLEGLEKVIVLPRPSKMDRAQ